MIESYYYPDEIVLDSNRTRSLMFQIYNQSNLVQGVSAALARAKDLMDSEATREAVESGDLASIMKNLEANASKSQGDLICSLTLPLPNTMSDNQSHSWNTETTLAGDIGSKLMNTSVTDTPITNALAVAYGAVKGSEIAEDNGQSKVAGALIGGIGGDFFGKALRSSNISLDKINATFANSTGQRKPIVDPGYFQNYTGSEPRKFNFTYDLQPKNTNEAEQIYMIIAKLKQYSSPSLFQGTPVLNSPYYFKLVNKNSYINALMAVDQLVLTDISVEYGADGNMELFSDGVPKLMKINLSFIENRIRTADDFSSIKTKDIHEDIND